MQPYLWIRPNLIRIQGGFQRRRTPGNLVECQGPFYSLIRLLAFPSGNIINDKGLSCLSMRHCSLSVRMVETRAADQREKTGQRRNNKGHRKPEAQAPGPDNTRTISYFHPPTPIAINVSVNSTSVPNIATYAAT